MSHIVRPLIDAGIIGRRGGARGRLFLRYEQQTRQLLSIASSIGVAAATDSRTDADRRHGLLMRELTSTARASVDDTEAAQELGRD
jgi:hypothetical protein